MAQLRHWKQHWDPTAQLVFTKRLLIAGVQTEPGDPVTDEIKAALGPHHMHRLKRWWEAKYLAIQDWQAPTAIQQARHERRIPADDSPPELKALGRGWFAVPLRDGTTEKVRGQQKAEACLAEVWAPPVPAIVEPAPEASEPPATSDAPPPAPAGAESSEPAPQG